MTDYPIVRFVENAGDTEARLDLNDAAPFETIQDSFSLGTPTLEIDPLAVAAPYGERTITLTVRVEDVAAVAIPAISALSIELLRRHNWLLFQFDRNSQPLWIRTYSSAPQPVDFESVFTDRSSTWQVPLELTAEAFVRGAKIELPSVVVDNNPSGGADRRASYVLPEIEGDAPAPLSALLETPSETIKAPLISVTSSEHPLDVPFTADLWSFPGASKTFDPAYVADGYYATDGDGWIMVTPPFAGRYKALLRCAFSDRVSVFDLNLEKAGRVRVTGREIGPDGSEPWMFWGEPQTAGWIDMGQVSLGAGYSAVLGSSLETRLDLVVNVIDGNGNVRIDTLLLIPVDAEGIEARTLAMSPQAVPDGPRRFYADADEREYVSAYQLDSIWYPVVVAGLAGRFPQVMPGRANTLHLLRNVNTGDDVKSSNTTVSLSYFPRYLHPLAL